MVRQVPLTVFDIETLKDSDILIPLGTKAVVLSLYLDSMNEVFRVYRTAVGVYISDARFFNDEVWDDPRFIQMIPLLTVDEDKPVPAFVTESVSS